MMTNLQRNLMLAATVLMLSTTSHLAFADSGISRMVNTNVQKCMSLMSQFDKSGTANAEAIALRNKAENQCGIGSYDSTHAGVQNLQKAFRLAGIKPAPQYGVEADHDQ